MLHLQYYKFLFLALHADSSLDLIR